MKIRKIKLIQGYKSFKDYSWDKFCINDQGQEQIFNSFNICFGENGSGKSSICEILKDLFKIQKFENNVPQKAIVEVRDDIVTINTSPDGTSFENRTQVDTDYTFENKIWTNGQPDEGKLLVFDVDFIDKNVHTHGKRTCVQGEHAQNSGKLIIDLDAEANKLKRSLEQETINYENFEKLNKTQLSTKFLDSDLILYEEYKNLSDEEKGQLIIKLKSELSVLLKNIQITTKIKEKVDISHINELNQLTTTIKLSNVEVYEELIKREIKEKTLTNVDQKLLTHLQKHKLFLERDDNYKLLTNGENTVCPLCTQPLSNVPSVISLYKDIFDQTYENLKQQYKLDIESLTSELTNLVTNISDIPLQVEKVFGEFERLKNDPNIDGIYDIDEKLATKKDFEVCTSKPKEIEEIINYLKQLGSITQSKIEIKSKYVVISDWVDNIQTKIDTFNQSILKKNEIIELFKSRYSDTTKIDSEILELKTKYDSINNRIVYLLSNKTELIKNQRELFIQRDELKKKVNQLEDNLETTLAQKIPETIIKKMDVFLKNFSLNFSLSHISSSSGTTKSYPFTFKITDLDGIERDLKTGLSEGERQLISLAFFFAINEGVEDKKEKVVIFDDPITSLDAPNLKILADLICELTKEFGQVFVFTHHPLFHKYLAKYEIMNHTKFGVLKNREEFGGSFMFIEKIFNPITKLRECSSEIIENAQKGLLNPEEIALRYGQLLRLSVEKFIKNELLLWNKEDKFDDITEGLKQGKNKISKLTDDDLDVVKNIFKFCNYSNLLHADKEIPCAIKELTNYIDTFIQIIDKTEIV